MANAVTISIAATDRTAVIPFVGDKAKVSITYTMPGIATAELAVLDQSNSITIPDNAAVLITDPTTPSNNAFQGYVQKRRATLVANYRWWELSCVDLNYWLDHKVVGAPDGSQFYESPPATFTAFDPNAVTQATDAATVQWLFSHYAADLPVDTTTFVQTMATLPVGAIRWNTVSLRSALQDLANLVGSFVRFWIDADWKFHWTNTASTNIIPGQALGPLTLLFPIGPTTPAAPFQLTDGVANHTTTYNYEDLSVEWDNTGWADNLYVQGATTYTLREYQLGNYTGGGFYNPVEQIDNIHQPVPIGHQLVMGRYPITIGGLSRYYVQSSGVFNSAGNDVAAGYYLDVGRATLTTIQANVSVGGSGWVGSPDPPAGFTPSGREAVLQDTRSTTKALREGQGGSLLAFSNKAVVRGSCKVYTSAGGWFPGQAVQLTNTPLGISAAAYLVQKVTTKFLSGAGYRQLSLDFGDAPYGTIGLRRNAQQSVFAAGSGGGSGGQAARRPASKMLVTVSNAAPAASGYARVTAQAVDWSGNPWPINGAAVSWSVSVWDAAGNDVTQAGGWSFTPGVTVTDVNGSAWGDLQTAATLNWTYFVTATMTL